MHIYTHTHTHTHIYAFQLKKQNICVCIYMEVPYIYTHIYGTSKALLVKNLLADAGDMRHRLDPWVRKIPWRRAWQPTPIF